MLASLAWRNLWRHRRRTLLTSATMAFSVAICLAMNGFAAGFLESMRAAIVDRQLGHIQLHHADYPSSGSLFDSVPDANTVLTELQAMPNVALAAPRIQGFALFAGKGEDAATGAFTGVDPAAEAALTKVEQRLIEGAWLSDPVGTTVVGERLAEELDLKVGGDLLVVTNAVDGSFGDRVYRVVGITRTNNLNLDKGAFLTIADAQDLLALGDAIHELVVLTDDTDAIASIQAAAAAKWPKLSVRAWWDVSPETLAMQGMTQASMAFFTFLIVGVAAFIIINTLLMSVYERTRELGILLAIGMRPKQVVRLILVESTLLAALSGALGLAIGGAGLIYLATEGVAMTDGEGWAMGATIFDPIIKAQVTTAGVVTPLITLLAVGVVGGLWPALRAAKLDPVDAIREE